jgi:ElaB/YqjD/DUF883 family membrane-anchored ribosome-binding protein
MNAGTIEGLSTELGKILTEVEAAQAQGPLRRTRQHLRAAQHELADRARALDRAVHANPWQVIAATGAVAFLLGLWVRRR